MFTFIFSEEEEEDVEEEYEEEEEENEVEEEEDEKANFDEYDITHLDNIINHFSGRELQNQEYPSKSGLSNQYSNN